MASSSKPAAPTASADSSPTFPHFLLPSFSLPFRRRRPLDSPSPHSQSTVQPEEDAVPSLSSSPGSASDAGSPASPSSSRARHRLSRIHPDTLRCGLCATDLAYHSQIVSKGFTGRYGRAYLVSPPSAQATPTCPASPLNHVHQDGGDANLINVRVGRPENRQLVTGAHVVADISCIICGNKLGWKYVDAREHGQKYKVGKFILETQRVVASHSWEDVDVEPFTDGHKSRPAKDTRAKSSGRDASTHRSGESHQGANNNVVDLDDSEIVFDSADEDECEDIFNGVWDAEVVAKRRKSKVANVRRSGGGSAAGIAY
ncbi:yippee zinc-binding/DNA-binding /Mis18, centromere assembly-domain-containing protein [Bombardia bombarda]|uniref:Yippee zinc-binding/DNA-binding /Mis18, centromere assembly-domain-containing protein n=1 Tax=Bombardia bombarda TaxID=252184 RepID=A0AA39X8S5_9PEZI|nr:yippee zinc-binding/DNA-binding /Mis18, centromere assembly-domain-containing protein [Bombardia bombarda]